MRTAATLILVAVAVIVQATIVNRIPFVWGPGPDLVLAAVVAVALTASPASAAACGFAAGLAMDILPPAEHAVGRYTLVLCLAAYLVALLRQNTGAPGAVGARTSLWTVMGVTAAASLGVGLSYAALGLVMGDPHIAPAAVAFNVGVGTVLTVLISPLLTLPAVRMRDTLNDSGLTTVQGPTPSGRW